jgi:ABC-type transport system substrate-binding protein
VTVVTSRSSSTSQTIVDMFAIQQTGATSSSQIATYAIADVTAVDDMAVLYTLSTPNSAFPAAVNSVPLGYVFEPAAAAADPVGFSTNPIGTGPFVMESRDIDNETIVVRNPNASSTHSVAPGSRSPSPSGARPTARGGRRRLPTPTRRSTSRRAPR